MSRCKLKLRNRELLVVLVTASAALCSIAVLACGPFFPNSMLDRGDDAVLAAPVADFYKELQRINLPAPKFGAVASTNDHFTQSTEADLADLRAALKKRGVPVEKRIEIVNNYETQRKNLGTFLPAIEAWRISGDEEEIDGHWGHKTPETPRPEATSFGVALPHDVPDEFSVYFRGTLAWHAGRTNEARQAWKQLLELPAKDRHYHSTWATYMLGRSWEDENSEEALKYYRQVRALASSGLPDRLGLAAASFGREARVHLGENHFERAIELYLQQMATGDRTAGSSLYLAAQKIFLSKESDLGSLAANPRARKVINAFIISMEHPIQEESEENSPGKRPSIASRWLDVLETMKIKDMESAEQLVLAAYQTGQWETAQRWINRARSTPVTQWIQAKLLLRAGKIEQAAALLDRVVQFFPVETVTTNQPPPEELKDTLHMAGWTYYSQESGPANQILAEVGVLSLARRQYAEAADAFLRAGFWMDAAYVAERVLTIDELKTYVDRQWPRNSTNELSQAPFGPQEEQPLRPPMEMSDRIRYLLARRLMRSERGNEARDYYPAQWLSQYDNLIEGLSASSDEAHPPEQRAAALFQAAKIARTYGMELLGTEVEPDWHIHEGDFEDGVSVKERTAQKSAIGLQANKEELRRATEHSADPQVRFHYRYQAAFLGLEAAKLMPNNTDEKARVLCTAGSWLKSRDPETADIFYKALVRQCRKTAIGQKADQMRWFPLLDQAGNLVPWHSEPPIEVASTDGSEITQTDQAQEHPDPGYWYTLNQGNSLRDVMQAALHGHSIELTIEDLRRANPLLNPARLQIGQRVFVPASVSNETAETPGSE